MIDIYAPILAESSTSHWSPIATFIGTLVALGIALLKEPWGRFWYKPAIALESGNEAPLSHFYCDDSPWVMLRLHVCNEGNEVAENVKVHIDDVLVYDTAGRSSRVDNFVPVRLAWSHGGEKEAEHISPGTGALVDFGKVLHTPASARTRFSATLEILPEAGFTQSNSLTNTAMCLCTETEPNGSRDKWAYPPGSYRFKLSVSTKRGVFWRGSVDVSFSHAKYTYNQDRGWKITDYALNVTQNTPSLGSHSCGCRS